MRKAHNLLLGVSALQLVFAPSAFGQSATDSSAAEPAADGVVADEGRINEIVVTARRREESLQSTPVAVTALSSEGLQASQIETIADLQRVAPSLAIATGHPLTSGFALVSIRGQGNIAPLISSDPAVGTYIDGVYIARPSQGITDQSDLQRVEVLRGPQGTLFGRNTTGGAISYITNDPVDEFEGRLAGQVANYSTKNIDAMLNQPLADGLALRVTYSHKDRDGYGRNDVLDRDVNDFNSDFVRGKLKYTGGAFDITLSGDYNRITDRGMLTALSGFLPSAFQTNFPTFIPTLQAQLHTRDAWYTTYATGAARPTANPLFAQLPADVQSLYDTIPYNRLVAYGFSGTINLELGDVSLKSITGYRYSKYSGLIDTDGTTLPLISSIAIGKSEQLSEELQIFGDVGDNLSYIGGFYISRETGYDISRSQVFGGLLRNTVGSGENITKGAYAQINYNILPDVRFTGGFRYTWDTRKVFINNRLVMGLPNDFVLASPTGFNCVNSDISLLPVPDRAAAAAVCDNRESGNFSYPAWTVGLDWQASDEVFLYAVTRGAAKAGGWNLKTTSVPAFRPEKVKDVEAGIKTTLLDGRLLFNAAAFYSWKKDSQNSVNSFIPGIGVTVFIQNQGDTRVYGGEFEVIAKPFEGFQIEGNLSLLDGKYKEGSYNELQRIASATPLQGCTATTPNAAGTPQYDCLVSLSGLPIYQLPKVQFNIAATQTIPVGDDDLSIRVDYSYIGSQYYYSIIAADQQPQSVKDAYAAASALGRNRGYGLLNGRISYKINDRNLELYLFGRNLLQKKYATRRYPDLYATGIGSAIDFVGAPRVYGLGVDWRFGQ